jgi:hypothetical protein
MTAKELTLFGMALEALIKVDAMDEVKKIVAYMATADKSAIDKKDDKAV